MIINWPPRIDLELWKGVVVKRTKRNRRGYVLFTTAAVIICIVGFAGLVMDAGYSEFTRRQAQAAADAGAKAAALEILAGASDTTITSAAKQDTANNGFKDTENAVTVTVNHPPNSGSYSGDGSYAEVIVTKTLNTSFMSILGVSTFTVKARGVGGGGSGGGCVYALDPTAQDGLLVSGGAYLNAGCGVVVESNNLKALEATGGQTAGNCQPPTTHTGSTLGGTTIQVVGNYTGFCYSSTPTTGITSPGDPLKNKYTRPTPGPCTATNWHNGGTTLSPGTYCGGITVDSGTVTASAGTYILYGGGLTVSGTGVTLKGTGVTFFNMEGSGNNGYKAFDIQGGANAQLSAPTSGGYSNYEGLLFWQDPNILTTDYNKQNTVSGGSTTKLDGALYFPDSPLVYSGGSSAGVGDYTLIVADKITFSGSASLGADYSTLSSGSPIKTNPVLAE
jgi:hypothetical protein